MPPLAIPTIFTILSTLAFFTLERVFPGRHLPNSKGWYIRAIALNLVQLGVTLVTGKLWLSLFLGHSLFGLSSLHVPFAEGAVGWLVATFFFYWWHRVRHRNGFWVLLHQIHHSPTRIELLTSFYKHPLEIFANSLLSALVLYGLLGISIEGAFWYNFFAATAEYFYHSNFKSPHWLKYIIQTPELHSIHHQLDVHSYNFADLPIWDKLFGTYRDTNTFTPACGFSGEKEQKLVDMMLFHDVNKDDKKHT